MIRFLKCAERYETSIIESPNQNRTRDVDKDLISPIETRRGGNNDESVVIEQVDDQDDDDEQDSEQNSKYIEVLKRYFGFSNFRKYIFNKLLLDFPIKNVIFCFKLKTTVENYQECY